MVESAVPSSPRVHRADHQAAHLGRAALALLQHVLHRAKYCPSGRRTVAALVGAELVDQEIRLSPAQGLGRPVCVVLLVQKAHPRSLDPRRRARCPDVRSMTTPNARVVPAVCDTSSSCSPSGLGAPRRPPRARGVGVELLGVDAVMRSFTLAASGLLDVRDHEARRPSGPKLPLFAVPSVHATPAAPE